MTDQLLGLFKLLLLLALYGFFARVLWAVWHEVRLPAVSRAAAAPLQSPAQRPGEFHAVPKKHRVRAVRIIAPATMKGIEFDIDAQLVTIGRANDNSIMLDGDEFASQHHARFERRDGIVHVTDLDSTNGTWVNGAQIDGPTMLRIGDRIHCASMIAEAVK